MAFVTDSNRPQLIWQPPPTGCLTASGASEVPYLLTKGGPAAGPRRSTTWGPRLWRRTFGNAAGLWPAIHMGLTFRTSGLRSGAGRYKYSGPEALVWQRYIMANAGDIVLRSRVWPPGAERCVTAAQGRSRARQQTGRDPDIERGRLGFVQCCPFCRG